MIRQRCHQSVPMIPVDSLGMAHNGLVHKMISDQYRSIAVSQSQKIKQNTYDILVGTAWTAQLQNRIKDSMRTVDKPMSRWTARQHKIHNGGVVLPDVIIRDRNIKGPHPRRLTRGVLLVAE